jgi:hypothetical protein
MRQGPQLPSRSLVTLGWIALATTVLAGRCPGQENGTPASEARESPGKEKEAEGFPITSDARELQVTAKGWEWQSLRSARLVFAVTRHGKPLQLDAVHHYQTPITDAAGNRVEDASQHLNQGPWKVRLRFDIQPEERQPAYTFAKVRVPAAGKATILEVPTKLKERGILFAALLGEGLHAFRNGKVAPAKSFEKEDYWAAAGESWSLLWRLDQASFVCVKEVPPGRGDRDSLFFRGYAAARRFPLFDAYPSRGWAMCGTGMMDDPPKTSRGALYREARPINQPAGKWVTIEGFDLEKDFAVEFTLPPPRPHPEAGMQVVIEEYKIPDAVFKKAMPRNQSPATADEHHAALAPVLRMGADEFSMYSPASQTLVIKASKRSIRRLLEGIEKATGFRPLDDPDLHTLFSLCAYLIYQPFPLSMAFPDAFDQHMRRQFEAAARKAKE